MKKYTYKHTLYACYQGYVTQAIVNNLAPLLFVIFQEQYKLSYEMVGRLILVNFTTQIIADIAAARYGDRLGYRKAVIIAHLFCAIGLILLGTLPLILPTSYLSLAFAVVIYAIGGGIIEVLISPIVESLPGEAKTSAMSLLHSFYCWGQVGVVLMTTLLLRLIGTQYWYCLPVLWSIIPSINVFNFARVPLQDPVPETKRTHGKQLLVTSGFWLALLLMLCAGASELTMVQWSSLFAEQGLGLPKVMGDIFGPCLFAVLMGVGRTLYGWYGKSVQIEKALLASGILCATSYAITVFSPYPLLSLFGCALCGLSVSLMWPGTLSLTAARIPDGGTIMFGLLAIFGDIGASVGPWTAGVVSDLASSSSIVLTPEQGLKAGLGVSMIFPVLIIIGMLSVKRIAALGWDYDKGC
ncbi:MAG TPA: MFS transporter [Firmicutes bacterium]|nr:MFS transporter [Bacillota bacterium]